MLSEKLINFCKQKNWWFDNVTHEYKEALITLGVDINSDFSHFYLHVEDCPTFFGRGREIYQICWFIINSNDYFLSVERTRNILRLPEEYIPLDDFQGEYGYFYNKKTQEVLGLGLGEQWHDFMDGKLKPQWADFTTFMEWFFELSD
ncbi:hypothetical protein [Serratia fonticola]